MRYFKVTRAGEADVYVKIAAAAAEQDPLAGYPGWAAEEVSRLPGAFERWKAGAWVRDEGALAEHLEDARLRLLTPRQRQEEAITKALARMKAAPGRPA